MNNKILNLICGVVSVVAYFFIVTQISSIVGFILWCFSNTYFLIIGIKEKKLGDCIMWSIYDTMNIVGILIYLKIF